MKKNALLFLLAATFFLLSLSSAMRESLTFDEVVYLQEGRNAVVSQTFDIDPYNPPLMREIVVFPYIVNSNFYKSDLVLLKNPLWGRVVMIFLSIGLIASMYLFVLKYVGKKEALFALFLASLEPDLLAHSHYVTLDMGLTLFVFLSFILLINVVKNPSWKNIMFLSLSCGLGMATKLSFIPYFFGSALLILLFNYKKKVLLVVGNIKKIVLGSLLVLTVIWATYFFSLHVVIKQRDDTSRVSAQLVKFANSHHVWLLSNAVIFLEHQPLPLGDYVATIKNSMLRSLHHDTCFFLGKTYSSCRWYFMPINFLLKTPIPLLVFFVTSFALYIKEKRKSVLQTTILIPIGIILISSVIFPLNPLVRYILPIFPFLIIFASFSVSFWTKTVLRKSLFSTLVLWYLGGTLLAFPHFISYANELTFGQKQFLLTDSNVDWGQSLPDVFSYMQKNNIQKLNFSYFGRDNGDWYGLQSSIPYGSYKANEICAFHTIQRKNGRGMVTLISISNWTACGYNKLPAYSKTHIQGVVGQSIFVF